MIKLAAIAIIIGASCYAHADKPSRWSLVVDRDTVAIPADTATSYAITGDLACTVERPTQIGTAQNRRMACAHRGKIVHTSVTTCGKMGGERDLLVSYAGRMISLRLLCAAH